MRLAIVLTTLLLGACSTPTGDLSAEAAEGLALLTSEGCAACHGSEGEGGIGPALAGLFDSTVTLDDGTTVRADEAYVRRSIVDPGADIVAGYEIRMPENALTPEQVESVVAWIAEAG